MTDEKRRRGKQKEPTLVHLSLRLPREVVAHCKSKPNYTQEIRRVLSEYVNNEAASRPLEEDDGDR